jgi:hypothetical protein
VKTMEVAKDVPVSPRTPGTYAWHGIREQPARADHDD